MVEGAALGQPVEQRRAGLREAHLVPADVRELQRARPASARTSPGTMPRPSRAAELGGGVEGELHAQADAEHRRARGDALAQQLVEAELAQVAPSRAGRRPRRAAPGRRPRAAAVGVAADDGARADVLERLLHRAAVAHAVVDDGDLHAARRSGRLMRSASPSCSARPSRWGRCATAWRSARANALKAASIMWWALLPASTRRCRVSLALLASARKNSSVSSCSKPPVAPGGSSASNSVNGPPGDVDRAARPRLVHGHGRGAVAGDPRAVAERLVERLAEHDRGVLGGVVGAGLQVAADLSRRGRGARGGRAGRACGRGSPRPCRGVPAPVPSSVERRGARRSRRSCARSSPCGSWLVAFSRTSRLHRFGVHLEALRAGDRGARGGELGGGLRRSAPRPSAGGSGAARASRRSARRRRWAARGWSPPRSRRRRWRSSAPTNRQPARAHHAARAPRPRRRSAAGARGRTRSRARSPRGRRRPATMRERRLADRRALDDERARARRRARRSTLGAGETARPRGCPRRARPGRACRAPPAAARARRRRRRAATSRSLGPAKPSMPTMRGELVLGLLHVQVAGPHDHVDALDASRCRRRARRSPGRRPCGTRAPRRTAGRCRGSRGRSARRRPGGAHTATSITPAARAVTTPITTVLG